MVSNWRKNELQAAKLLGLSAATSGNKHEKMTTLDLEMDSDERVVLTITQSGGLSVQVYKDSSRGRPLWALNGSALVAPDDLRVWAATLHEATQPPQSSARK
jgi:hypothetical protein